MNTAKVHELEQVCNDIIDRTWLENGTTPEELKQSAQLADLMDRLVSSGRSMKSVLADWKGRSTVDVLREYEDAEAMTVLSGH